MESNQFDVLIVGSGPAGYTAGIYLARASLKIGLLSGQEIGGQLMYTTEVENYPGFAQGVQGQELMADMRAQAERFGCQMIDKLVDNIKPIAGQNQKTTQFELSAGDNKYQASAVVLATGAKSQMLGLPGEEELLGRGLSVCAVCDAAFFRDRVTFVVGGGDSAIEDALALARFAKEVTLVHRRDSLRASKIMQERLFNHPKIKVLWNTQVTALDQENGMLKSITLQNLDTQLKTERPADGLFYAIGHIPATGFVKDLVKLNKQGYVVTRLGFDQASVEQASSFLDEHGVVTYPTMTSVQGIFAAGDNVDFIYRQAITAAGFGTMAALDAERYLERLGLR